MAKDQGQTTGAGIPGKDPKDNAGAPPAGAVATRPTLALEVKNDVVDVVAAKVAAMSASGELIMPADYSPDNAMKSAWLKLQTVKNKDGKLVLRECTRDSLANALLEMCTQGLTVAKEQGYFIAYGKELSFQRSYFGDMAIVSRIFPGTEFAYAVVWEADDFEYEISRGRKRVTVHKQKLENIGGTPKAGYCSVWAPGREEHCVIMDWAGIEASWKQSKTYKPGLAAGTTHAKFTEEMVHRTLIRRACKPFINASSDAHLLAAIQRADERAVELEMAETADEQGNAGEPLDIEPPAGGVVEAELLPPEAEDGEDANAARRGF